MFSDEKKKKKSLGVLVKLSSPEDASFHFKTMLLTVWPLGGPIVDGIWITGVVVCKMPLLGI